ncbi:MAG: TIGR00341 family protein [Lachnospiraceae bacterium]|nr:TIGR00341 family protein [Lachnospiraceae bacterium]
MKNQNRNTGRQKKGSTTNKQEARREDTITESVETGSEPKQEDNAAEETVTVRRKQVEAKNIRSARKNPYSFKRLFHTAFNLSADQASYEEIAERIESGVVLRGTNMCILILAIFIASVGLNMNSTAVIIGAMLVSPLMGAIMGMGFAVAIHDMDLLKRSATILLFEVVVALATSTVYFALTPIKTAGSELLARTSPAVWDVIIAVSGGLAGMIGTTRKEKSNIIPGVAIATALMPPLCTAGYGLAVGNIRYFAGAMYLFCINGVFIAISTMLITVFLRLPSKNKANPETRKQIHRRLIMIAVVAIVPSVFFAADIAKKTVFENNVVSFVENEFQFDNTQVVKYSVDEENDELNVAVIGSTLSEDTIENLSREMKNYHIDSLMLRVQQTEVKAGVTTDELEAYVKNQTSLLTAENEEDYQELQGELLAVRSELAEYQAKEVDATELQEEIIALYPSVTGVYAGYLNSGDAEHEVVILEVKKGLSSNNMNKLKEWLEKRLDAENIIVYQNIDGTLYQEQPKAANKDTDSEADGQQEEKDAGDGSIETDSEQE